MFFCIFYFFFSCIIWRSNKTLGSRTWIGYSIILLPSENACGIYIMHEKYDPAVELEENIYYTLLLLLHDKFNIGALSPANLTRLFFRILFELYYNKICWNMGVSQNTSGCQNYENYNIENSWQKKSKETLESRSIFKRL